MTNKNILTKFTGHFLNKLFILCFIVIACFFIIGGWSIQVYGEGGGSQAEEVNFTILHTNDEHSAVIPHSPAKDFRPGEKDPTIGGFARLASAVEEVRDRKEEKGEPVLLFNAGDFIGGGAFCWLAPQGNIPDPELSAMHEIGYDAAIIGNHEYDYGPNILADYLIAAGYPEAHEKTKILASNTIPPEGHAMEKKELLRQTGIMEIDNDIKVGIFGLIGNQAILVASDTGDLEFADQHKVARKSIDKLEDEGADIIVALTHSGIPEDKELARSVEGIDIIVGGHCHTAIDPPKEVNDTLIVQAGAYLEFLGHLELAYNPVTEELRVRNEENNRPFLIPIDGSLPMHEETSNVVEKYKKELNSLVREITDGKFESVMDTVARADFVLEDIRLEATETTVGNFVTDAMRQITTEKTGDNVDVAFQADGNIRRGIKPSQTGNGGEISFYDISKAVGIGYGEDGYAGYPITSFYLDGRELMLVLETSAFLSEGISPATFFHSSGLHYVYEPGNAVLFNIPILDVPVPGLNSINEAEIYTGEGKQPPPDSGEFEPVDTSGEELYHIVTDTYILSHFKMVADILPVVEPKNAQGEALDLNNPEEYLVHHDDGRELKVWETVVNYAANQPEGEDGIAQIPDYYAQTHQRVIHEDGFPHVVWVIVIVVLIAGGITLLVRRRKIRRRKQQQSSI